MDVLRPSAKEQRKSRVRNRSKVDSIRAVVFPEVEDFREPPAVADAGPGARP